MAPEINLHEILHPEMDILFVALNPPTKSNSFGHYFSGSWSFWNLMLNSGLISSKVSSPLNGDMEIFANNKINFKKFIYGVTDLGPDAVETKSSKIHPRQHNVTRILDLLNKHHVHKLALIHSKVGIAFDDFGLINRAQRYGIVGKFERTLIYELPFQNASISNKKSYYKKLI